ncbi:MAG: ketoacyl-ACP synthase III [Myxococcales bacterium]|jgi:3-oxoacyl-[acyl-carrier-protein] synthase-3|nr:ketoacyl-ACP synthase III [Myxococcales bacterium]
MRARITGTGGYLPADVLTSESLADRLGVTADWIVERTGIRARRIAAPNETTSQMATHAARQALEAAGIAATDLDLIVVGTVTPDSPTPSTAALVQAALGASNAFAFDVSAACAGGLFGLVVAEQFLKTGVARRALIVGAELLSRSIDWDDRDTAVLFGDGAGAVILEASEDDTDDGPGILARQLCTDGKLAPILAIPGPGTAMSARNPRLVSERLDVIHMQGREVFRSAVRTLSSLATELLDEVSLPIARVEHVMGHQANLRIIRAVMERIGVPMERCHINLDRYGNTSAASILLLIDETARTGALKPGEHLLCLAAGAGLVWGGLLLRW